MVGFIRLTGGGYHETKIDASQQVVTLVATSEAENRSPFMMGHSRRADSEFRKKILCENDIWQSEIREILSYLDK